MSDAMYAELEAWAALEFRSVNGQIEYLLNRAIQDRKGKKKEGDQKMDEPKTDEGS